MIKHRYSIVDESGSVRALATGKTFEVARMCCPDHLQEATYVEVSEETYVKMFERMLKDEKFGFRLEDIQE